MLVGLGGLIWLIGEEGRSGSRNDLLDGYVCWLGFDKGAVVVGVAKVCSGYAAMPVLMHNN